MEASPPKIAVTGATGLVGRALVKELARGGFEVTALARNELLLQSLLEKAGLVGQVATAVLDIADGGLTAALQGHDVVIHAAGFVSPTASAESIFTANYEGTRNCLEASRQAGVRQFIFISSLSVITGQGDCFDLDESAPLKPCGEAYADSKIAAEKLVMASGSDGHGLAVTVLRPGFIYGPGERAWLPRVIASIKSGKAALVDGGARQTNVVYVENLANAVQAAVLNQSAYGEVFNITDPEYVSKKALFDAIADGLAVPRVKKNVPRWLLAALVEGVALSGPLLTLLPAATRAKLSPLSRAAFRLVAVNQGFSTAKAARLLNYNKHSQAGLRLMPFAEAMKLTLAAWEDSDHGSALR